MMPYGTYQLWQAERARTDAEYRQAAARQGQIAAAVAGRSRDSVRPARASPSPAEPSRRAFFTCCERFLNPVIRSFAAGW